MENIVLELGINLWHASLVYLPRTLLEGSEGLEEDLIDQFGDRLIMLDKEVGAYLVKKDPVTLKAMHKATLLNDNLFKLLQLREQYPESASRYLFSKYTSQVEGFLLLTEWFIESLQDTGMVTKGQSRALDLQRETFDMHLKELRASSTKTEQKQTKDKGQLRQEALAELKEQLQPKDGAETPEVEDRKTRLQRIKDIAREHERSILKQIFSVKFREE